jgi:threonyl-tRNA synthetase
VEKAVEAIVEWVERRENASPSADALETVVR